MGDPYEVYMVDASSLKRQHGSKQQVCVCVCVRASISAKIYSHPGVD